MPQPDSLPNNRGLESHGRYDRDKIRWNLPTPALCELALQRREGSQSHRFPLVVRTGHHTVRSGNDRFIVDEAEGHDQV